MKTEMVLLGAAGAVIALVVVYTMMGTKKRGREEDDEPEVVKVAKGVEAVVAAESAHLADEALKNAVAVAEAAKGTKLEAITAKAVVVAGKAASAADTLQSITGATDAQRKAVTDAAKEKALELAKKGGTKVVSAAKEKFVTWWNNRKK